MKPKKKGPKKPRVRHGWEIVKLPTGDYIWVIRRTDRGGGK